MRGPRGPCPPPSLAVPARPPSPALPWRPTRSLARRDAWVPLADPVQVFAFDFADAAAHMAPAQAALPLAFHTAGVFNAVAMWFDLHLDQETTLRRVRGWCCHRGWQRSMLGRW